MQATEETSTARFNMAVDDLHYANVTVGSCCKNMTCSVTVPILTNTVALRQGEQLWLEVVPKATSINRKLLTWKTEAAASKRAATNTAVAVVEPGDIGRRREACGPRKAGGKTVDANVEIWEGFILETGAFLGGGGDGSCEVGWVEWGLN
jgi:hypothetical protein